MAIKFVKLSDSFYLRVPKELFEYFDLNEHDEYEVKIVPNKSIIYKIKQITLDKFENSKTVKGGIKKC